MVSKHIALVVWSKSTIIIDFYTMIGLSVLLQMSVFTHQPSNKSSVLGANYGFLLHSSNISKCPVSIFRSVSTLIIRCASGELRQ